MVQHLDNKNSTIAGRAWQLNDYVSCANGVIRTELFVHSEETSTQGPATQGTGCPLYPSDDPHCWEGDGDYYSLGCIKVARWPVVSGYSNLGTIDSYNHTYGIIGGVTVNP